MDLVTIGKVVSTHGIKGEVKVLSSFPYKDKAFVVGKRVYLGTSSFVISSYRVHQKHDLLTFDGIVNINEILSYLPCTLKMERTELDLSSSQYMDEDLLGFSCIFDGREIGSVMEIFLASPNNKIIRIRGSKEILIPFSSHFVRKIDLDHRTIDVFLEEGMIDAN